MQISPSSSSKHTYRLSPSPRRIKEKRNVLVSLQTLSNQDRELLFSAWCGDHCCTQRGGKLSAGTSTLQDVNSFVISIKSCDSFVTHCFHGWSSSVDSFLNESTCCCCCRSSECQKIVKNVSQCFYRAQVDVLKRLFCPRRQTKIFSLLSKRRRNQSNCQQLIDWWSQLFLTLPIRTFFLLL